MRYIARNQRYCAHFSAPPIVLRDPRESYSIVHTKALYIKCQIIAKPAANVTWIYGDNGPLPIAVSHIDTHVAYARVYTLTISVLVWNPKLKVDYHNRSLAAGKYRCTANNSVGFAESKETSLTMYGMRANFRFKCDVDRNSFEDYSSESCYL